MTAKAARGTGLPGEQLCTQATSFLLGFQQERGGDPKPLGEADKSMEEGLWAQQRLGRGSLTSLLTLLHRFHWHLRVLTNHVV